jgi:hypothetical protein
MEFAGAVAEVDVMGLTSMRGSSRRSFFLHLPLKTDRLAGSEREAADRAGREAGAVECPEVARITAKNIPPERRCSVLHSRHTYILFLCQRGNPSSRRFMWRLPALSDHWIIMAGPWHLRLFGNPGHFGRGKPKPELTFLTDVTGITARAYDETVIFRHEVMLRTTSTFHGSVTGMVTDQAAYLRGVAVLSRRTPVYLRRKC